MSIFEDALLEYNYVLTKRIKSIYFQFENSEDKSCIIINHGSTKYFRVTYSRSRYTFGLGAFDSELNLDYDVRFETISELKRILTQYLEATIKYAIPLLRRLPNTPLRFSAEFIDELAQYAPRFATEFANSYSIPIALNGSVLMTIEKTLSTIRCNDYSWEHFVVAEEQLKGIVSFIGEAMQVCINDCEVKTHKYLNGSLSYIAQFKTGQYFDILDTISTFWVYTPEFPDYTISMQFEFLRRQLRVDKLF